MDDSCNVLEKKRVKKKVTIVKKNTKWGVKLDSVFLLLAS